MASPCIIPARSTPLCECRTTWQHIYFNCRGVGRLYALDPDLEPDGRVWGERHEALVRMTRREVFYLEDLKRCADTVDLWNALHQEKGTLIRFLGCWHTGLKIKWNGFRYAPDQEEQENTYGRGLGLLNKIVRLLLVEETQVDLFGAEVSRDEADDLWGLLFDLTGLKKEDGTFMGRLRTLVAEASEDDDDGVDTVPGPEGHSLANNSHANRLILPIREYRNGDTVEKSSPSEDGTSSHVSPTDATVLYDVKQMTSSDGNRPVTEVKNALAEDGEEKARVDSGVGLDVVEGAQNEHLDDEKEEGEITDDELD